MIKALSVQVQWYLLPVIELPNSRNIIMKTSVIALLSVAVVITACAKRPEEISAVPMDTDSYVGLNCRALATKETEVRNDLDSMSAAQNSAATSDAWGVFLLGVPWSSMSGNDKEALIAVAKGRLDAIDVVQAQKNCG